MKLAPATLALTLSAFWALWAPPAHAADNCAAATTTPEVEACAERAFKAADARLNQAFQTLLQALPETSDAGPAAESPRAALVKAQRRWIAFRDADCAAKFALYAGGTIRVTVVWTCQRERTEQRIQELALGEWLH